MNVFTDFVELNQDLSDVNDLPRIKIIYIHIMLVLNVGEIWSPKNFGYSPVPNRCAGPNNSAWSNFAVTKSINQ